MRIKWNQYGFVLLLAFLCASNFSFASHEENATITTDFQKEFSDRPYQDDHAVQVSVYQLYCEENIVIPSQSYKRELRDYGKGLNISSLVFIPCAIDRLYNINTKYIIPGLGLDQLLFPHHFHT